MVIDIYPGDSYPKLPMLCPIKADFSNTYQCKKCRYTRTVRLLSPNSFLF